MNHNTIFEHVYVILNYRCYTIFTLLGNVPHNFDHINQVITLTITDYLYFEKGPFKFEKSALLKVLRWTLMIFETLCQVSRLSHTINFDIF